MKNLICLACFSLFFCTTQAQKSTNMENKELPCQIIFKINVNVVSKRPDRNGEPLYKYALLNICPERQGEIQRQVISFIWQEQKTHREFERELVFESQEEAFLYAQMNRVPMAYLKDKPERVEYAFDMRENGILPSDIRQDLVILEIEKRLPKDWELVQSEAQKKEFPATFSLQAKFMVWELSENKINAPIQRRTQYEELERLKKYGKEVHPQITFSLHQPWRAEELKAVSLVKGNMGDNPLTRFYRNTQYFGIKALNINGLDDSFHTVAYPAKQPTTNQVYEIVRDILEPKSIIGKAQNAKMGACLITDQNETYFMENWQSWESQYLNKRLIIKGLQIKKSQNQPLKNEKGEYLSGAEGTFQYLVRVQLPKVQENVSMVVVFKKEISKEATQKWMNTTNYYFHEGADSSKGKAYFHKTGEKYHILFPNEVEKEKFLKKYQSASEIYEIYQPNWEIMKD